MSKPSSMAALLAASVLVVITAAAAQDATTASPPTTTPGISGVVAAGTPIKLIKDGFNGTEGPLPLPDGSLIFTENRADRVIHIAKDGSTSTFLEKANGINAFAAAPNGDLYAVQTLKPRVGIVHPPGREKVLAELYDGASFGRPNDLVIDKRGGLYFTDSGTQLNPDQQPPAGKPGVYYLPLGGQLEKVASDIERPNGVQLSPDEKTLYVANTAGEQVLAYDIDKGGKLGPRRNFAKLEGWKQTDTGPSSGADGLAIDRDGRLYVASTAGVQVFSAKGAALGIIPLPKAPQNLAFAGDDKKTLYVVGRGAVYSIATLSGGYQGRSK